MDEQAKRQDHIDTAAKARSMAQERRAVQTAEIAGKQAQLKQEAQARREQKAKPQPGTKKTRSGTT
jgi:plasmid stability protein